jgi:hypothetical protein
VSLYIVPPDPIELLVVHLLHGPRYHHGVTNVGLQIFETHQLDAVKMPTFDEITSRFQTPNLQPRFETYRSLAAIDLGLKNLNAWTLQKVPVPQAGPYSNALPNRSAKSHPQVEVFPHLVP